MHNELTFTKKTCLSTGTYLTLCSRKGLMSGMFPMSSDEAGRLMPAEMSLLTSLSVVSWPSRDYSIAGTFLCTREEHTPDVMQQERVNIGDLPNEL